MLNSWVFLLMSISAGTTTLVNFVKNFPEQVDFSLNLNIMFHCLLLSVCTTHFLNLFSIMVFPFGVSFDTYRDPLFLLQKKILTCIRFQPFTAPSASLFHSLKILKLEGMLHLNTLTFVFKAINKLSPNYFYNYFTTTFYPWLWNSSGHQR